MADEVQTEQLYRQSDTTTTTATLFVRHDSNGLLTAEVDGQPPFEGDTIDTAVDDGTGIVTVSGLSANADYPVIVKVGGVTVHNKIIKTNPANDSFNALFFGCWGNAGSPVIYNAIKDWEVCTAFRVGDLPYVVSLSTKFISDNDPIVTTDLASDVESYFKAQRATMATSDLAMIAGYCENILIDDDHDFHTGDNYNNSAESLMGIIDWFPPNNVIPSELVGMTGTTQQNCNDWHIISREAKSAYYKGNIATTDANLIAGEVPESSVDPANPGATANAVDHPVEFVVKTIGRVDFFIFGCIENKTMQDDWESANGGPYTFTPTIWGTKQKAAAAAALAATIAAGRVAVSVASKSMNSPNGDGVWDYVVDRRFWVDLIDSYGHDHFYLACDYHQPNVFEICPNPTNPGQNDENKTDTVTILDVTFSPCGGRRITGPPSIHRNSIWNRDLKGSGIFHYERDKYIQFMVVDERGKTIYYSPRKYFDNPRFVHAAPPPKVN